MQNSVPCLHISHFFFFKTIFVALGMEPRPLYKLGKCTTTELYQPLHAIFQALNSHMWLVANVLNKAEMEHCHHSRKFYWKELLEEHFRQSRRHFHMDNHSGGKGMKVNHSTGRGHFVFYRSVKMPYFFLLKKQLALETPLAKRHWAKVTEQCRGVNEWDLCGREVHSKRGASCLKQTWHSDLTTGTGSSSRTTQPSASLPRAHERQKVLS